MLNYQGRTWRGILPSLSIAFCLLLKLQERFPDVILCNYLKLGLDLVLHGPEIEF